MIQIGWSPLNMHHDMNKESGQAREMDQRSRPGGSSAETFAIVAALFGWFVLVRWILPRMGVPT
jgi:hypothetical protein